MTITSQQIKNRLNSGYYSVIGNFHNDCVNLLRANGASWDEAERGYSYANREAKRHTYDEILGIMQKLVSTCQTYIRK